MNIHISEKREEPLLSRTRVSAKIDFDSATPSNKDVTSGLASHLKADEKLVVIKNIYTEFGHRKADVTAYVYSSEEKKNYVEPKVKDKKSKDAKASAKK